MAISSWVWALTIVGIVALLLFDYFAHVRKAHSPSLKEAGLWTAIYIGIAVCFGVGLWFFGGHDMGMEYFAGYITEKALSVDNLFVFLIIMSSFKVPRADQQKVLLFGIVVSLFARAGFIFLGAALINSFAWIFYFFGLILLVTAGNLLKPEGGGDDEADNVVIRLAKRFIHTTDDYDGDKFFTVVDGRRAMTPTLLVMIGIGGTDILFALDSIPAIFGLTESTYIVFTATAFSLMGLRQLYFLIDGLLDRLIYLSYGLAAILGFIGVKLILHALHQNNLPIINKGEPVEVIEVTTTLSLGFIIGTLIFTVLVSLYSPKGKAQTVIHNARRHATEYLDLDFETDPVLREAGYRKLVKEEAALQALVPKFRVMIRDEQELLDLLAKAHAIHEAYVRHRPDVFVKGDPLGAQPRLADQDWMAEVAEPTGDVNES